MKLYFLIYICMYICICIYYENSPARRKRVLRFSFKSSRETIVRSNYHKKKKRESLLLLLLLLKSIACSLGMKDYIYVYIHLCICICIYVYIRIHLYTYRLASKTLWTDKKKKKKDEEDKRNYNRAVNYWESSKRYIRKGICTCLDTCVDAHRLSVKWIVQINDPFVTLFCHGLFPRKRDESIQENESKENNRGMSRVALHTIVRKRTTGN